MGPPVLSVERLTVVAQDRDRAQVLVSGVSFDIERGRIFGLIGQSGSGKSLTCAAISGLLPENLAAQVSGNVRLGDVEVLDLSPAQRRALLGLRIGVVFQDPLGSLNPSMRIGSQIGETLRIRRGLSAKAALDRSIDLLADVGIRDPAGTAQLFPHQLSGGMRQRAMIATAISCNPELLIADEPTTALDPTIQRQVLDLVAGLARKLDLAVLLVTHNIGVVAQYADEVGVMLKGHLVEKGPAAEIVGAPRHDYTKALIRSAVTLENYSARRAALMQGAS